MLNNNSQNIPVFNLVTNFLNQSHIEKLHSFLTTGDDLCVEEKYTIFVSAHFSKDKQIDAELHCRHFRNKLDRQLVGSRKRLYKALFIEEGQNEYCDSYSERHTHWLFGLTYGVTDEQFTTAFKKLWRKECGSSNVDIKLVENKRGGLIGLYDYLTKEQKEGCKASFLEHCSDNALLQGNRQGITAQNLGTTAKENTLALYKALHTGT